MIYSNGKLICECGFKYYALLKPPKVSKDYYNCPRCFWEPIIKKNKHLSKKQWEDLVKSFK